jgi:transcriptional regulator with XRE-family HTH domain
MADLRKDARALRLTLGLNIRVRRVELGISQEELARLIGTSASHLSGIEHGRHNTSIDHLQRLAVALDIAPSALVTPRAKQSLS